MMNNKKLLFAPLILIAVCIFILITYLMLLPNKVLFSSSQEQIMNSNPNSAQEAKGALNSNVLQASPSVAEISMSTTDTISIMEAKLVENENQLYNLINKYEEVKSDSEARKLHEKEMRKKLLEHGEAVLPVVLAEMKKEKDQE